MVHTQYASVHDNNNDKDNEYDNDNTNQSTPQERIEINTLYLLIAFGAVMSSRRFISRTSTRLSITIIITRIRSISFIHNWKSNPIDSVNQYEGRPVPFAVAYVREGFPFVSAIFV